jgi:hypothetical protein
MTPESWRNGIIYWTARSKTFMLMVREGRVVEAPPNCKDWALARKVEDIVYRAQVRGATLHWQGPMFEVDSPDE